MCGIVAFIQTTSQVSQISLTAATNKLLHRGPDAQNTTIHANGHVGLGATRLKLVDTTDQSNQPFTKDHSTLVFNGEIYNYRNVKKLLQNEGCTFQTTGDTEVVITAVNHWGIKKALQTFRGSFVFVIYDSQKNQIYIARDIFGERQLTYTNPSPNTWLFASEVKALAEHPDVRLQPDFDSLVEPYLLGFFANPYATYFKDIKHFPSATFATIKLDTNQISFEKYWDHNDFKINYKYSEKDIPNLTDQILQLLTHSVTQKCAADVPIASLLSGGIDSSFITELASKYLVGNDPKSKLDCITAYYPKGGSNDYAQVLKMIDHNQNLRIQHSIFPETLSENFTQELTYFNEAPILHLINISQYQNYKTANDLNYKTVLNGQGSDEMWCGYYHTYDFMKPIRPKNQIEILQKYFIDNSYLYDSDVSVRSKNRLKKIVEENLVNFWSTSNDNYQDNLVKLYFTNYLPNQLRNEDRMSMLSSVEVRLPFVDQELIELSLIIPAKLKHHKEHSKYLLRQAGKNVLLKSIRNRAKTPFPLPQHKFLTELSQRKFLETVTKSDLVSGTFQWSKSEIAEVYKNNPPAIKLYLYFLSQFEQVFFT